MTAVLDLRRSALPGSRTRPRRAARRLQPLVDNVRAHRTSLSVLLPVLLVVGVVHAVNMNGWPGRVNDDEGTYVAQAWAVLEQGSLAHYTYAYDHPPLGWLTIALFAFLTNGFARVDFALTLGRELMLVNNLVSSALLFVLGRRLGLRRPAAAIVVLLFALAPVSLQYHRMVFLDNLALTWAIAAFALAASPRRSLAAAVGCGVCFAASVLTKETTALLLPAVVWTLVQHSHRRTRIWNLSAAGATIVGIGFFYPLYAMVKNEFLVGPGHVSLLGALGWQLFSRTGTGSLLDPSSETANLVRSWLILDPWLLIGGSVLIPIAFVFRRLRPIALALLLQDLVMLRGGYLPYPYVICLLPFAALIVGGVGDRVAAGAQAVAARIPVPVLGRVAALVPGLVVAGLFAALVAPSWVAGVRQATTVDATASGRAATAWVVANVPKDSVIIVDDYLWPDLQRAGFSRQIWSYKADLDPEVKARLLPDGYRSADYVALSETGGPTQWAQLPTVAAAIGHSTVVARFGGAEVVVRKVDKGQ